MFYFLHELANHLNVTDEHWLKASLNIFRYTTFRAGGACLTAFLLSVIFGGRVIRKLISLKIGQPVRTAEEVHKLFELHGKKAGTPTMGGVMILGSIAISVLLWARWSSPFIWATLFVMLGLGWLGFLDDYHKVKKRTSGGLSARGKLAGQFLIAFVALGWLFFFSDFTWRGLEQFSTWGKTTREYFSTLNLPFIKGPLLENVGWLMFGLFVLIIIGSSNAVNLTDGLDGLAIGCTVTTALAYTVFSYVAGHRILAEDYLLQLSFHPMASELAVFSMAIVGAGLGFLWFNCHPAQVFMGDTGSLSLGGTLAMIAICCRQEIVLALVGGVFVMEALSVIIQVISFKTRGKRVFRMAPIHHHFELGGWAENKVITRFWTLSIFFALLALATLKIR